MNLPFGPRPYTVIEVGVRFITEESSHQDTLKWGKTLFRII